MKVFWLTTKPSTPIKNVSLHTGKVFLASSERLVEIIKGFLPSLFLPKLNEDNLEVNLEGKKEDWRKATVCILAVICGIITAFLASPILAGIFKNFFPDDSACKLSLGFLGENTPCGFDFSTNGILLVIALGLLASDGSSFWNSILEYLLKVKDLKKSQAKRSEALRKIEVERAMVRLDADRVRLLNPE